MSALKTENVSAVLDSCHSGEGKRGNLTIRSLGGGPQLQASSEETEYQRQWLFGSGGTLGVVERLVIASATPLQESLKALREIVASQCPFPKIVIPIVSPARM